MYESACVNVGTFHMLCCPILRVLLPLFVLLRNTFFSILRVYLNIYQIIINLGVLLGLTL